MLCYYGAHMPVLDQLKHNQARELVLRRIRTGHYRPGQRLPSERELAQDLELSHITIRRGLAELVEAGLIVRRPRIGTFVQETQAMELSNRVAIIVPEYFDVDGSHPFLPVLTRGVMAELNQRDYAISLLSYHYSQFWHDAGEAMLARGITGAIMWSHNAIPRDQIEKLAQSGIKVVLLNALGLWPEFAFSSVSIDLTTCMREAMQRLVDLGHRRIIWLSYLHTHCERFETALVAEFARKYRLENPDRIIVRLPDEPTTDYSEIPKLLADAHRRPTAIILQDEFIAHEIFRVCHRLGLRVPEDISLVSIADSTPKSHLVPLSAPDTIGLWTSACRRASEHLRLMIGSESTKQIEISLHAAIQWKASTGKPRQPDRSEA